MFGRSGVGFRSLLIRPGVTSVLVPSEPAGQTPDEYEFITDHFGNIFTDHLGNQFITDTGIYGIKDQFGNTLIDHYGNTIVAYVPSANL